MVGYLNTRSKWPAASWTPPRARFRPMPMWKVVKVDSSDQPGKVGSSSFEIYIGIEEHVTSGQAVVDGSLGYLGLPAAPIPLTFRGGSAFF